MDLENNSNEADALLKKRTPDKRRGLALTLAVALRRELDVLARPRDVRRERMVRDPGGIGGRRVDSPVELPFGHRQDRRRG